jgi:uncharacterized membrane protein
MAGVERHRPDPGEPRAPGWLVAAMRRLEEATPLDGAAELLGRLSAPLDAPRATAALRGDWLGHALHPLLTDFPLGAWIGAACLDIAGGRRERPAATGLVAFGIAAALPTAAAGVVEWRLTAGGPRRVGMAHAALNGGALLFYGASLAARIFGRHRGGVALGLAGGVLATAGGYLGGHLSLVHKVGTADPALRHVEGTPGAPSAG